QTSARPGGRPREQIAPTGRGCCSRMRGEGVPAPRRFDHGDMTIVEISAELAVRIGEHFGAFAYDPLEVVKTPRNLPFGLRVVQAEQDRVCAGVSTYPHTCTMQAGNLVRRHHQVTHGNRTEGRFQFDYPRLPLGRLEMLY